MEQLIQAFHQRLRTMSVDQQKQLRADLCTRYPQMHQRAGESQRAYATRTRAYLVSMTQEKRNEILSFLAGK